MLHQACRPLLLLASLLPRVAGENVVSLGVLDHLVSTTNPTYASWTIDGSGPVWADRGFFTTDLDNPTSASWCGSWRRRFSCLEEAATTASSTSCLAFRANKGLPTATRGQAASFAAALVRVLGSPVCSLVGEQRKAKAASDAWFARTGQG